ncbi:MAG: OmpA family protein [Bacteroidota bacterium]
MNRMLSVFCGLLFTFFLQAQNYTSLENATSKQRKTYIEAKKSAFRIDYEGALKSLRKLLKSDPSFIDAWILKGEILADQKETTAAIAAFQKALDLDENYNLQLYYMCGVSTFRSDRLEEAVHYFKEYIAKEQKDQRRLERAKKYIEQAEFRATQMSNPVSFELKPMSAAINTNLPEYLPSLTADGEMFIFVRRVDGQDDFYFSEKEQDVWKTAQPIRSLNTSGNEGSQSISADGRTLIFGAGSRKDGYGRFDLYVSEIIDGQFTRPLNLGERINSAARERQPSLSSDGKILYYESTKSGGRGGSDIWCSSRQADGTWGRAKNLGAVINTKGNEQSPFIHPDGKTLYFMSNGHLGMGGFDLFVTRRQADGSWSKPQNLGYPINNKANQGAIVVSLDGKTAYYTSDEAPPAYGGREDIYTFEMPESVRPAGVTYVKAIVRDAKTKRRIAGAKAEFIGLEKASTYAQSYTDAKGSFLTVLPVGEDYALNVSAENYLFYSENFALLESKAPEAAFEIDVFLMPIPKASEAVVESEPIILKNIFFESNKATLLPKSLIELNQLKKLLEEQTQISIQINGHTDNVGSEEDNLTLSENRAKAVHDYLIEKGIAKERLSYKGFGENQPIASNESASGRQQNRRTEFIVLKKE